jgi:hypothetical protein
MMRNLASITNLRRMYRRAIVILVLAACVVAPALPQSASPQGAAQPAPAAVFQPVGNMSQLMVSIIYPTSDSIFYVERTPPTTEKDWNQLQSQALMLAEAGNLLLMPGRARDQGDWVKDSKLMIDVGAAAFKAARGKDLPGIVALNDQLNTACVTCHEQYRPNYRKRRQTNQSDQGGQAK